MFNNIYSGKKVLVTGHTGFKGSWLCAWLKMLGAEICGVALESNTTPNHFELLENNFRSEICNICDAKKLQEIFADFQPEAVFHLAAQPIVRLSYKEPVDTFAVNVMGTVNVLEACRHTPSVRAVVAISSDKCYENREQLKGYTENDPMGGYDPYSASKGCTELVISSYRRSFFNISDFGTKHHTLLASARAGNVIGGGDWACDRLVPDIMKSAAEKKEAVIRSPKSVRPWQHVLEPLSGYLLLGEKLLSGDTSSAEAWNFGPDDNGVVCVEQAADALKSFWSDISLKIDPPKDQPHEAKLLLLDCTKAAERLNWKGVLTLQQAFEMTSAWYRSFYTENLTLTLPQIEQYISLAQQKNLSWTK